MSFVPRCPRCGGDVEIIFLAPGDKAARCNFCDLVVDLPDGESRSQIDEEEVRPDGTRVVRHVVQTHSDGVAPANQEQFMKSVRGQLERAAADNPDKAERIFEALGKLDSGSATVKVVQQSQVVSNSGAVTNLSSLPADVQAQVAQALAAAGVSTPATAPQTEMQVRWSDGRSYPCKLVERRGDQCLVEFGDGSRRWLPAASLAPKG